MNSSGQNMHDEVFQHIDKLEEEEKITPLQSAGYKTKFFNLMTNFKRSKASEARCVAEAKGFTRTLEQQRRRLRALEDAPADDPRGGGEAAKLRAQLLGHRNEIAQADERIYQLEFTLENLIYERNILMKEYKKLPKEGEMEMKMMGTTRQNEELRTEISHRKQEVRDLAEELESRSRQLELQVKEYDGETNKLEVILAEIVDFTPVPSNIEKEADKVKRQKSVAEAERDRLSALYATVRSDAQAASDHRLALEGDVQQGEQELERRAAVYEERQAAHSALHKEHEFRKEREAVLLGDRATLELHLRHATEERRLAQDQYTRRSRERERETRTLKRSELQLRNARDALLHCQQTRAKLKATVENLPKDDALLDNRRDLQKEVAAMKRGLAQQAALAAVDQMKVEESLAAEQQLLRQQETCRAQMLELTRIASSKVDEKDAKARDFARVELRYHRTQEELVERERSVADAQKTLAELQLRLREFAKMYDVIKNERNGAVGLLQATTRRAAEMRDKTRVQLEETEALRAIAHAKHKALQKSRFHYMNSVMLRDGVRCEVVKQQNVLDDLAGRREQRHLELARSNVTIGHAEERMLALRRLYASAVKSRNERGIQLIERNEEICVFQEKLNTFEHLIRNGDVEMQARDDDIDGLQMALREERHLIALARDDVPRQRALEAELATLQVELARCQDRISDCDRMLECPGEGRKTREIEGAEPSAEELSRGISSTETRLARKQVELAMKEATFEATARLAEKLQGKVERRREGALCVAKEMSDVQARLREAGHRTKALISELSMYQAMSMQLHQAVKEKELAVQQAYMRLENGEPSSEDILAEWHKMVRDEARRAADRQMKADVTEEALAAPSGVVTRAEPRPNAYLPITDAQLPVPRPYGAIAPFKPAPAGANMRHVRKPQLKPIEI